MIRILHIVTYMGRGGLETMLMNYYRFMDREKIQFDFLVHRPFEADYDAEICRMGGHICHISRMMPWSRHYRIKLQQFFRKHPEYRIIHVHLDCFSAVVLQCARSCGIPVRIAHSHSAGACRDLKYPIRMYWKRQIPDSATDLLACGATAGKWMYGRHAFGIMPNAVDLETYCYHMECRQKVRKAWGIENGKVIGHVGRFHPVKNHGFLIRIFEKVLTKIPEARLLLVGDGDGKSAIMRQVCEAGLEKYVIFTGNRSDVALLMQGMDLLVFPSLYEGFPVTIVEAQATGLPCLISDTISAECMLIKELTERCLLEDAPDIWAGRIAAMLQDDEMHNQRSQYAQKVRDAGYGICEAARKMEKFYMERWKNA